MCANTPRKNATATSAVSAPRFCWSLLAHDSVSPQACVKGWQVLSLSSEGTTNLREVKEVITCISLHTLTDSLSALLHRKAVFCHLPAVLFALGGTACLPHLICREASEPSSLFCTAGWWLKVWKARSQGTISLGKRGKHFLFLPYTCLWVAQPLSAKLRPAWLALRARPVPKSRPAMTLSPWLQGTRGCLELSSSLCRILAHHSWTRKPCSYGSPRKEMRISSRIPACITTHCWMVFDSLPGRSQATEPGHFITRSAGLQARVELAVCSLAEEEWEGHIPAQFIQQHQKAMAKQAQSGAGGMDG